MLDSIKNLLKIKSIITIVLTIVFASLLFIGREIPEEFTTVYTAVIGFYFGTQYQKGVKANDNL